MSIAPNGAGRFSVVMAQTGTPFWWYYGLTSLSQISNLALQNGARLVDLEPYYDSLGNKRFAVIMVKNT
jgi:hypothetical protein